MSGCLQAIADVAHQSGLDNSEANDLSLAMLSRLIHEEYSKLNRVGYSNYATYQPQPQRKGLPSKQDMRHHLLDKIACMHNPPWEPPSREDGAEEAMELYRIHFTKHLTASMESCRLHAQKEAISAGSEVLAQIADDMCTKMLWEAVGAIVEIDRRVA